MRIGRSKWFKWIGLSLSILTHMSWGAEKSSEIDTQLKSALLEAQMKLGELETWQKVIYTEEVMPQYQRFIRDYHPISTGIQVEVDLESLTRYLLFYVPKNQNDQGMKSSSIVVFLRSDKDCQKCSESKEKIRKLVQRRFERRGLACVWVDPNELNQNLVGTLLEDRLNVLMKQKKAIGSLILEMSQITDDDLDSAHADEKRYLLLSSLNLGEGPTQSRKKELFDTDSFELSEIGLLTDLFTEIGQRIERSKVQVADLGRDEVLIQVVGFRDFQQYVQVKSLIQSKLKNLMIVERKMSREEVILSAYTSLTHEEVKNELQGVKFDSVSDQKNNLGIQVMK